MIKIGIVGSGGIARAHASAYKGIDDVEIVAVCDIVPGRAEDFVKAQELGGARAFDAIEDLLALDLDGVSVCTPNIAHHSSSIAALRAGKHVLCEKPMAITLEQAEEMAQTAKKSGKILSIGFQPRYDPNMRIITEIVRSGALGKIYYVETGGGRRRGMARGTFIRKDLAGAGAVADIGCYSIDLVMNALGHPKPLSVSAATYNHFGTSKKYHREADNFEVEDFGAAIVRLEGDITFCFKISWAMHMDTLGATMFLGTDAGLKVAPVSEGPGTGVWDGRVGSVTLYQDFMGHQTQSPIPLKKHSVNVFHEKVIDFVRAVRDGAPAPIPGEEIVRSQAIIDGILRSSAIGKEVEIAIPEI